MNNLERAQRDWENPPDEPEAEYCDECGQEMEYHCGNEKTWDDPYFECNNGFCPSEFNISTHSQQVVDMAEHLVEVEESLKSTQRTLKYVRNKLDYVQGLLDDRELTIATLEERLTRSQEGE